jgi:hypothetical protein
MLHTPISHYSTYLGGFKNYLKMWKNEYKKVEVCVVYSNLIAHNYK